MKPSVILYKALPDDLLQRLQEHFTVHQVANLSPQTVEQNAAIFAEAEGLLGSNENVDAALLEKMSDPDMITSANAGGGASYSRQERIKIQELLELYQLALEYKQTGRIGQQSDLAQFVHPVAVRF